MRQKITQENKAISIRIQLVPDFVDFRVSQKVVDLFYQSSEIGMTELLLLELEEMDDELF